MFGLTITCTFKWWKITELTLTHPLVNPHGPADLVVGDGDALGLEELLEGEHGREHSGVHHRSWNNSSMDGPSGFRH